MNTLEVCIQGGKVFLDLLVIKFWGETTCYIYLISTILRPKEIPVNQQGAQLTHMKWPPSFKFGISFKNEKNERQLKVAIYMEKGLFI